jgi:hypothetical protein
MEADMFAGKIVLAGIVVGASLWALARSYEDFRQRTGFPSSQTGVSDRWYRVGVVVTMTIGLLTIWFY